LNDSGLSCAAGCDAAITGSNIRTSTAANAAFIPVVISFLLPMVLETFKQAKSSYQVTVKALLCGTNAAKKRFLQPLFLGLTAITLLLARFALESTIV
jgi:hypothetical protein